MEMEEQEKKEKRDKKKRGGQPGNKNAFKHGLYSKAMQEMEKKDYNRAAGVEGIEQEIALLRLEILKVINGGSTKNLKLILKAADVLDKMVRTNYKITLPQRKSIKDAMGNIIKDILVPLGVNVGTAAITKKINGL
jgi:hypothetical protein